jgi:copper chaperone
MATSPYVFRVEGMHCGSCPLLIDDTLEDVPGVSRSRTELKAGLSTVWLDAGTDPQRVLDAITSLGYAASAQAARAKPGL